MGLQVHNSGVTDSAKPPESAAGEALHEVELRLEPGQSYELVLQVAEACQAHWEIGLIGSGSCRLAVAETQTIRLVLPPSAQPRSLLRGQIVLRRADGALLRSLPVCGWVRIPRRMSEKKGAKRPHWLKLALVAFPLCLLIALIWHHVQPPTLIVEPGQMSLGTLWYSPPVGGHIETAIVFTTRWQAPPRNLDNPVLIAREALRYVSETGQIKESENTIAFPLTSQASEARIPLGCYNLSNEIVRVSSTISLTLSNTSARVLPGILRFKAEFKPVAEP